MNLKTSKVACQRSLKSAHRETFLLTFNPMDFLLVGMRLTMDMTCWDYTSSGQWNAFMF